MPLRVSLWSAEQTKDVRVSVRWAAGDAAETTVLAEPFTVTDTKVAIRVPSSAGPNTLVAEVVDATGARLCANRLSVEVQ